MALTGRVPGLLVLTNGVTFQRIVICSKQVTVIYNKQVTVIYNKGYQPLRRVPKQDLMQVQGSVS